MMAALPGAYGDLVYRGSDLVVVRSVDKAVVCDDWTADVAAHGHLMFLNAVLDPMTQDVYASGKANIGATVVIVGPDNFKTIIPGGYGNYPSQVANVDGMLVCYVVLNFTEYGVYDLEGTLIQTLPIPPQYHGTSQGIRFVADDGTVMWGDQTMAGIFEGLTIREWMQRGGYTGGQGQDGGFALSGNGVATLYPSGNTFFPRIAVHDQQLALLYVNAGMVNWDTLTLPLEAVPPPAPLQAPKIDVRVWDKDIQAGVPWSVTFDVSQPSTVTLEKDADDLLRIGAVNDAGEDHTGLVRQLTVVCPDVEPGPEPEPEPEPMTRFIVQPNIGTPDVFDFLDDLSPLVGHTVSFYVQEIHADVSTPQLGTNIYPNFVAHDVFRRLKDAGVLVNVEIGSVKPGDCQAQNNINGMQWAVQRIADAGGEIYSFSVDEPLTANQADGGCHQSMELCADAHAAFTHAVRALGPIKVVYLEAWPEVALADQERFLQLLDERDALPDAWRSDIDWNRSGNDARTALFIRDARIIAARYGIPYGLFVNATVDPIPTDEIHHANLVALARKIYGIAPDIHHLCVASWAHRVSPDPTHATQNVPNCLGAYGMHATFEAVQAIFAASPPEPEPIPEVNPMLYKIMDGAIRIKELKPSSAAGKHNAVLHDDRVVSIQPGGEFETRDPGTDAAYEQCYAADGLLFYEPKTEKRYAYGYRVMP